MRHFIRASVIAATTAAMLLASALTAFASVSTLYHT